MHYVTNKQFICCTCWVFLVQCSYHKQERAAATAAAGAAAVVGCTQGLLEGVGVASSLLCSTWHEAIWVVDVGVSKLAAPLQGTGQDRAGQG